MLVYRQHRFGLGGGVSPLAPSSPEKISNFSAFNLKISTTPVLQKIPMKNICIHCSWICFSKVFFIHLFFFGSYVLLITSMEESISILSIYSTFHELHSSATTYFLWQKPVKSNGLWHLLFICQKNANRKVFRCWI